MRGPAGTCRAPSSPRDLIAAGGYKLARRGDLKAAIARVARAKWSLHNKKPAAFDADIEGTSCFCQISGSEVEMGTFEHSIVIDREIEPVWGGWGSPRLRAIGRKSAHRENHWC